MAGFDFTSPKKLFESLIHPVSFDEFFSNTWEKQPLVIPSSNKRVGVNGALFTKKIFEDILKRHSIQFDKDVAVGRFRNNKQESFDDRGRITDVKFSKLHNAERATVQFLQPQRFQDNLWRIFEYLESFFGSLVSSSIYIMPGSAKGFAPRYDNTEIFVMQLEGQSAWNLYKASEELPRNNGADDHLGDPSHKIMLKPGDLLYFPRGTIYETEAPLSDRHSLYITISTYQYQTWGDYMTSVFPHLMEEAMQTDVDFRRGLPINFIKSTKLLKTDKVQSVMSILLKKLVNIKSNKFLAPESMIEEFMARRLPPFNVDGKSLQETLPEGPPPNIDCKIRLKYPDHVCMLIKKNSAVTEDGRDFESEGSLNDSGGSSLSSPMNFLNQSLLGCKDEEVLYVHSSLYNDRLNHMISHNNEENNGFTIRFPKYYLEAVNMLKSMCDQFTVARELPLELLVDKENLIRALWSCHLLEVIPRIDGKQTKCTKVD